MRSKVDDNLTDLASMSHRLRDLPVKVDAQPEFRDGLRAMLMATIERDGIGATAAPEPAPSRRGSRSVRRPAGSRPVTARRTRARGAIVVGLAAGTLALSGMSAASGDAIPGDPLYSVKRSTERAQLALKALDLLLERPGSEAVQIDVLTLLAVFEAAACTLPDCNAAKRWAPKPTGT